MTEPGIVAKIREACGEVTVDASVWAIAIGIAFNATAYDHCSQLLRSGKSAQEIESTVLRQGEGIADAALYFATWYGRNIAYIVHGEAQ